MSQPRKRKQMEICTLDLNAIVNRMHVAGMHASEIARILEIDAKVVISSLAPAAAITFAKQLLDEPEELKCPISMALMEDAVVAEDGYSYERGAIQSALRQHLRSPMTNNPIGGRLLPNQSIKSQVVIYKERLVRQVLHVAPTLVQGDPQLAYALLCRSIDIVKPKLPESSAKKTLIQLLGFQLRLPQLPMFADSTPAVAHELAELFTSADDCLQMLEAWLTEGKAITDQISKAALQELFHATIECACSSSICFMLGKRLLQWAPYAESPYDLIWEISDFLSDAQGDPWTKIAAQAWIIRCLEYGNIELDVKACVLQHAAAALQSPESCVPAQMFGVEAYSVLPHSNQCDELKRIVLLELARRRRLRHEDIVGVAADRLSDIARSLGKEHRCVASAEVSVLLAETLGDEVESAHSFLDAYKMNPENEVAKQGVLRTAPALGRRCKELQQRCKDLRDARHEGLKQS